MIICLIVSFYLLFNKPVAMHASELRLNTYFTIGLDQLKGSDFAWHKYYKQYWKIIYENFSWEKAVKNGVSGV